MKQASLIASTLLFAGTLCAQVAPGHAVFAWKPPGLSGPGGLRLIDHGGTSADIQGLDPETIGTNGLEGARSVLVTSQGLLYAGLGLDNQAQRTPRPLHLRRIALNGATAVSDQLFTALMMVPGGQLWHVSDLKERADGSLLVAATETVFTANPMPTTAVFTVTPQGAVTQLSNAGYPAGTLLGVADAGDRYLAAFMQSFFVVNIEIVSIPFSAAGPAPFQVCQFVSTSSFGGMDLDVDGTIIVGIPFRGVSGTAPVVRLPHAPNATPVPVAGVTGQIEVCDVIPAPALVAWFPVVTSGTPELRLVDTLAGGSLPWAPAVGRDPIDLSVRGNPVRYGPASPSSPSTPPWLGSAGGLPRTGNTSFAIRAGGTPGAGGVLLAGVARANLPTPFGTLLLDPARLIIVLAPVVLPNSGSVVIAMPIPADPGLVGAIVDLQTALFPSLTPLRSEMSAGAELLIR